MKSVTVITLIARLASTIGQPRASVAPSSRLSEPRVAAAFSGRATAPMIYGPDEGAVHSGDSEPAQIRSDLNY